MTRRPRTPSPHSWRTLSKKTILDHGKFLVVEDHAIELPGGRKINNWPWIITPDFVNVVALTKADRFLCFRQTKYALSGLSLSIVGGFIEKGEHPLPAARRELLEETGHAASSWVRLGSYRVDPNRGVAMGHLFLARGARRVAEPASDDLEEQRLLHLNRRQLEAALTGGRFKVLAWAAAAALALRYLSRQKRR